MKAKSSLMWSLLLVGALLLGACEDKGPDSRSVEVINQLDTPARVIWAVSKRVGDSFAFYTTRHRGRTIEPGGSTMISPNKDLYTDEDIVTIIVQTEAAEKEFPLGPGEKMLVITE